MAGDGRARGDVSKRLARYGSKIAPATRSHLVPPLPIPGQRQLNILNGLFSIGRSRLEENGSRSLGKIAMFCPMQLDCKLMTGEIHNCPNVSECLRNSPLRRRSALHLYFLNLGVEASDIENQTPPYSRLCASHPSTVVRPSTFTYNRDYPTRDRIIFGRSVNWEEQPGGIKHFCELTATQLQQLIDGEFANPNSRHNLSPTISALLEFALQRGNQGFEFTFEGYGVHPSREDYRTSIDGISFEGTCPPWLIAEFRELTRNADELTLQSHHLRAWWD